MKISNIFGEDFDRFNLKDYLYSLGPLPLIYVVRTWKLEI